MVSGRWKRQFMEGWELEWVDVARLENGYHMQCDICTCVDSLKALIKSRQEARGKEMDNFFDSLAEKYAPKAKKSKPSKAGKKGRSTS